MKENFRRFWQYVYPGSAQEFFDEWYAWAVRTRLNPTPRLERLRFKRMLDWIVQQVAAELHDGSMPYVVFDP